MDSVTFQPAPEGIDWPAALDHHGSWIRKVVNARLRHAHDVDDVVQEISSAVFKQDSRPQDPEKVAPWLYGVAVRQASQFLRKRGQHERLLDRYAEQSRENTQSLPNPREWVMQREQSQGVRYALEQLPADDREILILKYSEELSYRQLASLLGVTEKVVEHRLLKARKALRRELKVQQLQPKNSLTIVPESKP